MNCPFCLAPDADSFHENAHRAYLRCATCALVFVPEPFLPSIAEEKAQYDLHENSPEDSGYRTFLNRLAVPLRKRLPDRAHGLDFGSGPGPTLSVLLEEAGHRVRLYDPIYAPDTSVLQGPYDFITATEVFEHLHQPARTVSILYQALQPHGLLGIMTKRVQSQAAFRTWHYIQDPTHVCFWSETTFRWLANSWSASVDFPDQDVVILQKSGAPLNPVLS